MLKRIHHAALSLASGCASRLIPRTNNVWVFGGNKGLRFADNSMYFFKFCSDATGKTNVWLTNSRKVLKQVRNEGYQAHMATSLLGLYYGFRAKWHIFDVANSDTNAFSSVGANQLNLWHGYPLKDIRCLKPTAGLKTSEFPRVLWNWLCNRPVDNSFFFVLHQNKKYLWQITESFDVKDENVIIANYPRNIVFSDTRQSSKFVSQKAKPWIKKLELLRESGKRVLGYFPTWRTGDSDQFMGTRCVDELVAFNDFLSKHDLVVVTKWHTCVFKEYRHAGASSAAEEINMAMQSNMSNIVVLDFEQDLNSLLNQIDVLISDYSSVIVDYLLSGKPQIFMAYDLDAYKKEWGFMFDYESFVPGPIVATLPKLKTILSDYANSEEEFGIRYEPQRSERRMELFENEIGSKHIVDFMEAYASLNHSQEKPNSSEGKL